MYYTLPGIFTPCIHGGDVLAPGWSADQFVLVYRILRTVFQYTALSGNVKSVSLFTLQWCGNCFSGQVDTGIVYSLVLFPGTTNSSIRHFVFRFATGSFQFLPSSSIVCMCLVVFYLFEPFSLVVEDDVDVVEDDVDVDEDDVDVDVDVIVSIRGER